MEMVPVLVEMQPQKVRITAILPRGSYCSLNQPPSSHSCSGLGTRAIVRVVASLPHCTVGQKMTCDALSGILKSWLGVRWHTENVTRSHLKFKVNVRLLFSWRFAVFIRMFKIMIMYMHMLMYIHVSVHVCCFHFLVHITNHMCNTCMEKIKKVW